MYNTKIEHTTQGYWYVKHKIRNLYCSVHVSKMSFQHKKQTFTDIQVEELR